MVTTKMKLLALATASTLFLTGCGDTTADNTNLREFQQHRTAKNSIQQSKQNLKEKAYATGRAAKEKAAELTAKGLRKTAHGAATVEETMDGAADYVDPDLS